VRIDGAGHMGVLEAAETYAEAIAAFAGRVMAAPTTGAVRPPAKSASR
jgi:hypothetical protein